MLSVGLTGGIGAGKSTVVARLAERGAWIIDADRIAREVVEPGSAGLRAVVEEFGEGIVTADGGLDRPAVAALVFGDPAARERLDAIVHPLVASRSAELLTTAPPDAIVVQDIPLLVETERVASFPLVVVVHADPEVRLRRLLEQRGMSAADAQARIAAQATDDQRHAVADVWLDNSGSCQDTFAAVDRLWTQRLVPFEDNLRHRRCAPRPVAPVLLAPEVSWPQQARRVIARLRALAGGRAHRVDHIGSTSVPGLAARDVLEVQVVAADLDEVERLADDLIAVGLVRRAGRWCASAFPGSQVLPGGRQDWAIARNADPGRAVDCHLRPADSPIWRETLLLRDWLRAHPERRCEYAELKYRLAARTPTTEAYADAKAPFIRSALERAERWAARNGWRVS